MPDPAIPPVLVATAESLPPGFEGWLARDLDIAALVRLAESAHPWLAVDLDTVEGLNADSSGVRFAVGRLGADAVISRRPQIAALAADLGAVGLVRVFAFDSTGLRRSLEPISERMRVGTVVSPGIVLPYLDAAERRVLPRPLLAYGLIETAAQVRRLLGDADAVVVRQELAATLGPADRAVGGALGEAAGARS